MDAGHFDRLVRSWSGYVGCRRTLLALLATLPFLGGLAGLPDLEDEVEGRGRRKRRKKRCKPHPISQTCQGTCGLVKNNCKKTVDCGACACDPSCPVGQTCQSGECRIACGSTTCDPASEICVDAVCQSCHVTCNAADHTCNGTDLQAALGGGGTVYVCPGRYIGGFTLAAHVTVIGAGQGEDERAATILDGLTVDRVLSVANAVTATLNRVRITGGAFSGLGAGVYNNGDLTLTACTVTANTASDSQGGGLFNGSGASLTMTGCTVSDNTTAGTIGSRHGAGIAGSFGGTVTLTDCTISGNISSAGGGGIQNEGTLVLEDCSLEDNRAEDGDGGGVRNAGGSVTLTGGSVEDNFASRDGGGLYTSSGTVEITGVSFQNNDPDNCSGAVIGTCV